MNLQTAYLEKEEKEDCKQSGTIRGLTTPNDNSNLIHDLTHSLLSKQTRSIAFNFHQNKHWS